MKKRGTRLILMAGLLTMMLPGATLAAKKDSCPPGGWSPVSGATLLASDRLGDRVLDPSAFYCAKVSPGEAHEDAFVVGPMLVFTDD